MRTVRATAPLPRRSSTAVDPDPLASRSFRRHLRTRPHPLLAVHVACTLRSSRRLRGRHRPSPVPRRPRAHAEWCPASFASIRCRRTKVAALFDRSCLSSSPSQARATTSGLVRRTSAGSEPRCRSLRYRYRTASWGDRNIPLRSPARSSDARLARALRHLVDVARIGSISTRRRDGTDRLRLLDASSGHSSARLRRAAECFVTHPPALVRGDYLDCSRAPPDRATTS